jgi:hypothetical protein
MINIEVLSMIEALIGIGWPVALMLAALAYVAIQKIL